MRYLVWQIAKSGAVVWFFSMLTLQTEGRGDDSAVSRLPSYGGLGLFPGWIPARHWLPGIFGHQMD